MRTLAALAIAALGYRAAALFAATVSFPWLGVAVMTFLMAFCHGIPYDILS